MPKIGRDTFLYLERTGGELPFAQCASCALYLSNKRRCLILDGTVVPPEASCGMYIPGPGSGRHAPEFPLAGSSSAYVRPEEVGFLVASVRCENCTSFDTKAGKCNLYDKLNLTLPDIFQLSVAVSPEACCNAWEPKDKSATALGSALAG